MNVVEQRIVEGMMADRASSTPCRTCGVALPTRHEAIGICTSCVLVWNTREVFVIPAPGYMRTDHE